jgi:arylsulfatase A-like enzyme
MEKRLFEFKVLKQKVGPEWAEHRVLKTSKTSKSVNKSVIDWLSKNAIKNAKRFLWIHYFDAHAPYNPPFFYKIKYLIKNYSTYKGFGLRSKAYYSGEVAYIDNNLGKLIRFLKQIGIYDNSLFIITADHGESLGEHNYSGHGHNLYEESMRIPFILYSNSNSFPKGKIIDSFGSTIDIAPTILDLIGIDITQFDFDGTSLRDTILGNKQRRNVEIYQETFYPMENYDKPFYRALYLDNMKLILEDDNKKSLFDIKSDPKEHRNLIHTHPIVAENLYKILVENYISRDEYKKQDKESIDEQTKKKLMGLGYL